ncbi:lysylphosphatidylglycerol synthase transmembrane domain-containing protein [Lujinxingia litoralis]|nr:lysylphosphatidylglycerol synthase transmembrane domain-containing protein [Lujinxingia litoralis]
MSAPAPARASIPIKKLVWALVSAVVLYGGFALWADLDQLLPAIARVPIGVVLMACALSALNYGLRFARWELYLRRLQIEAPTRLSFLIFLAGLVMSLSPGKVGEVLKSALLRRSLGVAVARSAPVVFAERLSDLLGLFLIGGLGILTFKFGAGVFAVSLVAVLLLIAALQSRALVNRVLHLLDAFAPTRKLRPALEQAYTSTRALLSVGMLSSTTLLSALSWSLEGVAFWMLLDALGAVDLTLFKALFVYAISTLLGALSFLPGGLGLTEGTMVGALMLLGLLTSQATALAATYLIRLTTLWFGVGVGLLALLAYERQAARRP